MVEWLRVRIPAGAAGEFPSPESTFCVLTLFGVRSWPQSSQLAKPLWTDPGMKSGISAHEVISTLKKKAQAGNE